MHTLNRGLSAVDIHITNHENTKKKRQQRRYREREREKEPAINKSDRFQRQWQGRRRSSSYCRDVTIRPSMPRSLSLAFFLRLRFLRWLLDATFSFFFFFFLCFYIFAFFWWSVLPNFSAYKQYKFFKNPASASSLIL